jgi:hypothetical protein
MASGNGPPGQRHRRSPTPSSARRPQRTAQPAAFFRSRWPLVSLGASARQRHHSGEAMTVVQPVPSERCPCPHRDRLRSRGRNAAAGEPREVVRAFPGVHPGTGGPRTGDRGSPGPRPIGDHGPQGTEANEGGSQARSRAKAVGQGTAPGTAEAPHSPTMPRTSPRSYRAPRQTNNHEDTAHAAPLKPRPCVVAMAPPSRCHSCTAVNPGQRGRLADARVVSTRSAARRSGLTVPFPVVTERASRVS